METIVNVHEAKTHFSKLLEHIANGEEIVITKAGHPVARLTGLLLPRIGVVIERSR